MIPTLEEEEEKKRQLERKATSGIGLIDSGWADETLVSKTSVAVAPTFEDGEEADGDGLGEMLPPKRKASIQRKATSGVGMLDGSRPDESLVRRSSAPAGMIPTLEEEEEKKRQLERKATSGIGLIDSGWADETLVSKTSVAVAPTFEDGEE